MRMSVIVTGADVVNASATGVNSTVAVLAPLVKLTVGFGMTSGSEDEAKTLRTVCPASLALILVRLMVRIPESSSIVLDEMESAPGAVFVLVVVAENRVPSALRPGEKFELELGLSVLWSTAGAAARASTARLRLTPSGSELNE